MKLCSSNAHTKFYLLLSIVQFSVCFKQNRWFQIVCLIYVAHIWWHIPWITQVKAFAGFRLRNLLSETPRKEKNSFRFPCISHWFKNNDDMSSNSNNNRTQLKSTEANSTSYVCVWMYCFHFTLSRLITHIPLLLTFQICPCDASRMLFFRLIWSQNENNKFIENIFEKRTKSNIV